MLATGLAVGLESPAGTGASTGTDPLAHHRVCSCFPTAERAGCHTSSFSRSCLWIRPTYHCHPPRKTGRFTGTDFPLQPDGTLRCPPGNVLVPHERRRERDGSLRVVYSASIRDCRPCPLRGQCQWQGSATKKPRQVGVLLHPVAIASAPLYWRDWSRRGHRRACIHLLLHQRVEVQTEPGGSASATPVVLHAPLSRPQRAHTRLSWQERLTRNARVSTSEQVTIRLFGVPEAVATSLGLAIA